jgi:methylmalonyl-CoA/ethylmalonyl-CoA epimerase
MTETTPYDPKQIFKSCVQVGCVVADLDRSIDVLTKVFGIGPFRCVDWPPVGREDMNRQYYGRSADFTARMAFAEIGAVELELIQPLSGESIWLDFLREHGGGIHHIRYNVEDMDTLVQYLAGQGIGVSQQASGIRPGTQWANFDTEALIGFTIEVMKPVPGTDGRTPMIVDGTVQAD